MTHPPLPTYKGKRYTRWVPDTLDLADRADLAIHALAGTSEPARDYAQYFLVTLTTHPPKMILHRSVGGKPVLYNPKMWEALILNRLICGNHDHHEMERQWARQLWEHLTGPKAAQVVASGRMLATATLYGLLTGEESWSAASAQAVRDYQRLLAEHQERGEMGWGWSATLFGWTLQGLCQYLRVSGDEAAYDAATRLAYYLSSPQAGVLDEEGRLCAHHGPNPLEHQRQESIWDPRAGIWPEGSRLSLHFHHNTNVVLALTEYALATGDKEIASRALQAYTFARSTGSRITGYYPEYIGEAWPDDRPFRNTEGCCVADMVAIQALLTRTRVADLLDDLDYTLRNTLATIQMLRGDWMYRVTEALPTTPDTVLPRSEIPTPENATALQVPERNVGAFGGWVLPNDLWAGTGWPLFQHCCLGNCARALYYGWASILKCHDGILSIDLLMNRASPWADVHSYLPYRGQVDVQMKAQRALRFRLPAWARDVAVTTTVNGTAIPYRRHGPYVELDPVSQGATVTLKFPLAEQTVHETLGGTPYTLVMRGAEVVWIEPRGRYYPLFERAHLRTDNTRWVRKMCFVSDQSVEW